MDTQTLIDQHNDFKKKWLQLNEQDLFDWIMLLESMFDMTTRLRSKYQEYKQQLDVEIGLRMIALKSEIDDKGKKIHTESTAEANINQEFFTQRSDLAAIKLETELLQNKTSVIQEYINIVKMNLKK